jgi:hypothetical protein
MEPYIKSWFEQVKKDSEESHRLHNLEREAQAVNQLNKARDLARRTKPLTEQIEELMRSLPPQLRDRPWSMTDLVCRLRGKYRDRPHPQQVGEALRKLGGWRRVRLYGKYDGTRLWLPPGVALPI